MNNHLESNYPIGIFDSGVGGLTVLRELIQVLPDESFVYLGDVARVPYGNRSKDVISRFAYQDLEFLLSKKVKLVVIACNTVSSVAAETVKAVSTVPVFDVVTAGVENISWIPEQDELVVIGTRATINSHAYANRIHSEKPQLKVTEKATPLLVPLIEEGEIRGNLIRTVVKNYLEDIKKISYLLLGCTHYPLIEPAIRDLNPRLTIINPARQVAMNVKKYIKENQKASNFPSKHRFYLTDIAPQTLSIAEKFLGFSIADNTFEVTPFT